MKKKLLSLCLALLMLASLCASFSACASRGTTLMKAGGEKISVNVFQLYLARMKGSLGSAGYKVNTEDFWNTYVSTDNTTNAQFYTRKVYEGLRQIAAALVLYDELSLSLSESAKDEVDAWIDKLIKEAGSKSQLNSILSAYGANITTLRDAALIEAKIAQLKTHLYGADGSLISATAKEEFYKANYCRGYQMQLANYYYDREKDKDGVTVFYTDTNFNHIAYKKEGEGIQAGEPDKFGDTTYLTADGKISYDIENGKVNYYYDDKGNHKTVKYTDAEMAARLEKAQEIANRCVNKPDLFLELAGELSDNADFNEKYAPNGMYFTLGSASDETVFATFSEELFKMEIGELTVLSSDSGYYILMRAELDDGAWNDSANSTWFSTLTGLTMEYMLKLRTDAYLSRVEIDEKVLSGISIVDVEPDYYY